jgi:hypothetical protein
MAVFGLGRLPAVSDGVCTTIAPEIPAWITQLYLEPEFNNLMYQGKYINQFGRIASAFRRTGNRHSGESRDDLNPKQRLRRCFPFYPLGTMAMRHPPEKDTPTYARRVCRGILFGFSGSRVLRHPMLDLPTAH